MIDNKLQEELRARYNPDGSDLRSLQLHLLDILIEFDRICRKNNIDYWLEYGTLIGAARHGGFIPWDDDIDVCIMKKDKKRLQKVMREQLNPPFYYEGKIRCWGKLFNSHVSITRMIPEPGGKMKKIKENIWLDVFLEINGTPKLSRKITGFYGKCLRRRYRIIDDGPFRHAVGVCLYPIASFIAFIARIYGKIFHPSTIVHDFGTGYYSERKKFEIFPLSEIKFEGHTFMAPHDTPAYLKRIFGDWEKLPDDIENHKIIDITTT